MRLKNNLAWLLAAVLFLTACVPQQPSNGDIQPPWSPPQGAPWGAADIRALQDPGENGSLHSHNLVGLSLRQVSGNMQVRVDFLDLSAGQKFDLHLAFDLYGQGQPLPFAPDFRWDARIDLPSDAEPQGSRADGKALVGLNGRVRRDIEQLNVTRDIQQGIVILTFDPLILPGSLRPFHLLVWTSLPGQLEPQDQIGPVRSDAPAPLGRAAVVLAFWDDLPAATPAQALRRWDGAHTGPFGQRHGLHTLLDLAGESNIPLFLLDLKKPASLSALDSLGGTSLVKSLAARGLVTLPDVAWGDPQVSSGLESSRDAGRLADLPDSLYLSGASSELVPARYRAAFANLPGGQHVVLKDDLRLVPLPEGQSQVDAGGLSVAARRTLLTAAFSADPTELVVMGGSLPTSGWGDIFAGGKAMRYLANHPWIRVLSGGDLFDWPACSPEVCLSGGLPCSDRVCPQAVEMQPETSPLVDTLRSQLGSLALDPLDPAWQSYLTLTDPQASADLQALHRNYLGQVGGLAAAAEWARAPYSRSACDQDLDGDGQAECVLASTQFFGIFDPQGARLVFGFIRSGTKVDQIVGPASQFAVGLSDPGEWRLDGGLAVDPAEIGGGFFDATDPWLQYQASATDKAAAEAQAGNLVFTSPDGKIQKTFQLLDGQLQATYQAPGSLSTRLPLVIGSQGRFSPGWIEKYHSRVDPQAWTWEWGDTHLQVTTTGQLEVTTFLDSLPWLQAPEDPNRGYPPGHYLPFPMAVAEIQGEGTFKIVLTFR